MKTIVSLALIALLFASSNLASNSKTDDCNGCEYDLEFIKTINNGDDSKYELKCKKTGNRYDIYKRKNGNWESQMSSKQYEDKCVLIKYLCDCEK